MRATSNTSSLPARTGWIQSALAGAKISSKSSTGWPKGSSWKTKVSISGASPPGEIGAAAVPVMYPSSSTSIEARLKEKLPWGAIALPGRKGRI